MTKRTIVAVFAGMIGLGATTKPADAMPVPTLFISQKTDAEALPVAFRRGFYEVGGVYYYNGHRGYVRARPGYRYYNGYWFPAAAFAAGVAAGAAVVSRPMPATRMAAAHVRWCYDRYVSYRAWDNSYQPYVGPRRQCFSPYG